MTYLAVALLVIWTVLTAQTLVNLFVFRELNPTEPSGPPQSWPMVSIRRSGFSLRVRSGQR